MKRLTKDKRVRIIAALCEGCSIRGVSRMVGLLEASESADRLES